VTRENTLEVSISDTIKEGVIFEEDELTIEASYESSTAYE